jgi:outer membrane protein
MKKIAYSTFMAIGLMVASLTGTAQAQKIAVVNSQDVLAKIPEAIAAGQRLEGIRNLWQDSLKHMQTATETKFNTYKSVFETLTPEMKEKAQQEVNLMQEQAVQFQNVKFGQNGEFQQAQTTLMQPILNKVKNTIESIAKRDKYALVIEKQAVYYSDNTIDITEKVVQALSK